ncbi:DUF3857 domain-containing protein [Pontibacter sp. MBLB2868]|uniref:DUF3857 domain-containing protein n=1 Tax=Pontibacter sp. MBLB2868 TaxID=3451555 RepID=UPI003F752A44
MKATSTLTSFILFFALIFGISSVHAQEKKFGKVEEAELKMDSYPNDTSAAAVILFDHGETRFTFNHEMKVVFDRHIRIKILKKAGYDWANVSIPFYIKNSDKERVTAIKGYTFNLVNGVEQKDKLESKSVFEEQNTENWYAKKFTMPNVKEGSVLDLSYSIQSDFIYTLREWEFQTSIPTIWSEYHVEIPEYFDYKFVMQGYLAVSDASQGRENAQANMMNNTYYWILKDVPALKEERYITTLDDYQSKIEFELEKVKWPGEIPKVMTGNWEEVTKDLLAAEEFGLQLNRNNFFKDDLAAVMASNKEPKQQMEAIYELVKKKVKWDGKHEVYAKNPIRKVYDAGTGSAAEINLLLTSMLLEAGLDAAPVLLSTRTHGKIRTAMSPMLSKFNYVIAQVKIGEEEFLLDATDPLLPAGMLPVRCLNGEGRLIKKNDQRWVALKPVMPYSRLFNANLTINKDGEIVGTGYESAGGYKALALRRSILEEGETKYSERIAKEVGDFKVGKPKIENLNSIGNSLNVSYDIKASGSGQVNDIIYLNPMLGYGEKENPFKLTERTYPVDFATPIDETYICRFVIPDGYEIEEAPKSVAVNLPENNGRFIYMVQQEGNVVQVMSKVNINKPVFYAPEYPYLKELYNHIVAKHAEQIVIKRSTALK